MGGLGHYLEEEGLATTQISLIREHTERMRPPRALWVPFELGRPLGTPNDAAFQTRVLVAALRLLEAKEGPILVDFPDEAPGAGDLTGWACPIPLAPLADEAGEEPLRSALEAEVARLGLWYELAARDRGRSTVGTSGIETEALARFVTSFLGAKPPPSTRAEVPAGELLKLACDDLKAYYAEAASAQPGDPTSEDLAAWFWDETVAGEVLFALRDVCRASADEAMKDAGESLVPLIELHRRR